MTKQEIFHFLTYLTSTVTAREYLLKCYKQNNVSEPEKKGYENCYRFLYYLEHGQMFYQTGMKTDLMMKPMLFFYGMVHLIKACLLTVRPEYPENTAVLAHGVSSRKRKKQNYTFLRDEVKLQYKGLFPYATEHLFQEKQPVNDKLDMKSLLTTIPEMNDFFRYQQGENSLVTVSKCSSNRISFPSFILDNYHLTENGFIKKITKDLPPIKDIFHQNEQLIIEIEKPLSLLSRGPFYYHIKNESFYFPKQREHFSTRHEVMNHYLLLYNLSMICRYETEWWGDLLHSLSNEDYPFIKHFLTITPDKVTYLLGHFLYNQLKK